MLAPASCINPKKPAPLYKFSITNLKFSYFIYHIKLHLFVLLLCKILSTSEFEALSRVAFSLEARGFLPGMIAGFGNGSGERELESVHSSSSFATVFLTALVSLRGPLFLILSDA